MVPFLVSYHEYPLLCNDLVLTKRVRCAAIVRGRYSSSKLGRTVTTYSQLGTVSSLSTVLLIFSSFYIEFQELYWGTIDIGPLITTDPDLNVVSCRGG